MIGKCFSKFLRYQVEHSDLTTAVRFHSALPEVSNDEVYVPSSLTTKSVPSEDGLPSENNMLDFKVLTPLFYDRLVHYTHISEFLHIEFLEKDDKDRTLWTLDSGKLLDLFRENGPSKHFSSSYNRMGRFDRARWSILRTLRRPRSHQSVPQPSKGPNTQTATQNDIRSFAFSLLDQYVMASADAALAQNYRRTVTKVLISEYIAFGIPQLITAFNTVVGLLLCYISVMALYHAFATEVFTVRSGYLGFGKLLLASNGLHLWRLLETYL